MAGAGNVFAAGEGGGHHKLPPNPEPIFGGPLSFLSNSILMTWLAVGLIVLFCRTATKEVKLIPEGMQNFAEWLVESVYDFFGTILGDHLVKRAFWFYGSVFFFILVNNYLGLIPGVGTMGWKISHESLSEYYFLPWMRGGNADLNLTAAMAFTFAALWFYWAISENGFKGFLAHIFAPKGMAGPLLIIGVPIFLFVGILEMVSIAIRPVALSFRLYGNIYGGEQTLESLMMLVPKPFAFLPALPFYFMELLVGLVQALVFTLLSAVFLKLICDHDHGDEEHH